MSHEQEMAELNKMQVALDLLSKALDKKNALMGRMLKALKPFAAESELWTKQEQDLGFFVLTGDAENEPSPSKFTLGDLHEAADIVRSFQ